MTQATDKPAPRRGSGTAGPGHEWVAEGRAARVSGARGAPSPVRIDELMELIRSEARLLEREERVAMDAIGTPLALREMPSWSPTAEFPCKPVYHVNELLCHDDDIDFVTNAYAAIMRRAPDESGLDTYVSLLREHGPSRKLDVVLHLLESEEGRRNGTRILGIRLARFEHRRLGKWWLRPLRLPFRLLRRLARSDLQVHALASDKARLRFEDRVSGYLVGQREFFEYARQRARQLEGEQAAIHLKLERYRRDTQFARQNLLLQERRLNCLLADLREQSEAETLAPQQRRTLAAHSSEKLDAFYMAFENECRGEESVIRERLSVYLPVLAASATLTPETPLLDIGSGRGEWLALLRDEQVPARGVDISRVLVAHCRARKIEVTHADALALLRETETGTLGAVTAFHVIEHLPFEQLYTLVEECHRALVPGGRLIFETPNPENLMVASHTFWHDPTHRQPITPTLIEFLARHLGFADTEIMRLHPYPPEARLPGEGPLVERINGAFTGPQDFALLAVKPDCESGQ